MSKKIDLKKLRTRPIRKRIHKVKIADFANTSTYSRTGDPIDLLPSILKGTDFREISSAAINAVKTGNHVAVAIGGHVIKSGVSPLIIDLVNRGIITAVAMNGSAAVHDLEIALIGQTSEDVEKEIRDGHFGMVTETGHIIDAALRESGRESGFGAALGNHILSGGIKFPHADSSLLTACARKKIPCTVHVAIGTDTVHAHPAVDGALYGEATMTDFIKFAGVVAELKGGVYFNIGSAVIMPEVFLKALSTARNLGYDAKNFTTVNFDMVQHYRPAMNVVSRPTKGDGKGYAVTGHHEILVPLLYHSILSGLGKTKPANRRK